MLVRGGGGGSELVSSRRSAEPQPNWRRGLCPYLPPPPATSMNPDPPISPLYTHVLPPPPPPPPEEAADMGMAEYFP